MANELTKRKWVYVSGPYTQGDPVLNTRHAISVGINLWNKGFTPLVPHVTMLWQLVSPQSYRTWMDMDMEVLSRCDALLRLPGTSPGAEEEVAYCQDNNIPVFHDIESVEVHFGSQVEEAAGVHNS